MSRLRARAMGLAVILLGLAIALAAIPRLGAGLALWASEPTFRILATGRPVPPALIAVAANERSAALARHRAPGPLADVAALRLRQSETAGESRLRAALLDLSIRAGADAVALAPGQPYAWTNLAAALVARDGPERRFQQALRLAILTGPAEPALVLPRLELAFLSWDDLAPALQALAAEQIRIATRIDPRGLARVARATFALARVRDALADDDALLARFDRAFLRH